MRIDSHVHGNSSEFGGDPAAYIAACRKRDVEGVVLIDEVEGCLDAVNKFGDFVIPVAWSHMDEATPADVEAKIRAGCKGIKFIRPKAPYGDERYWPLYEKVFEMGAVAVYHTGYVGFYSGRQELKPEHMSYMRASEIDVIARRFPDLKILMAHFSNPWWEEAWKVSLANKNVYADLSGGTAIIRSLSMWAETFAPDGHILEDSVRKLCFGSDVHYFEEGKYPFERYCAFYDRIFDRIGLSDELREVVNRGNIRMLFGLDGG